MRLEWSGPGAVAALCGVAFITGFYPLFGTAIGLATGLFNAVLLWIYTRQAVRHPPSAHSLYAVSLMLRMAMLAAVFSIVAKLEPDWMLETAAGIAAGIVFSIVIAARRFLTAGEGGEKHA